MNPTTVPLILTLDQQGIPLRWIGWQRAVFYYVKDLVAWVDGEHTFTFHGGYNRETGKRSRVTIDSIIAISGRPYGSKSFKSVPSLNNRELFRRDRHLCAYCGKNFSSLRLTRDHITPLSRGGHDVWMNVVTACRHCNQRKSGLTLEQAKMELIYAPYVPNKAEYLILSNRNILADQMNFLTRHVGSQNSRVLATPVSLEEDQLAN